QHDFSAGARHYVVATQYHKCGRRWLNQSLQAVPARRWNAAQFFHRIQHQIEDEEGEISVAQKKISGLDRFSCFFAADPKQVLQGGGIDGLDIEGIASINESEKKSIALCDLQQAVNEQSRASARIRADDFGDCAFAETTRDGVVEGRNAGNNLSAGKGR